MKRHFIYSIIIALVLGATAINSSAQNYKSIAAELQTSVDGLQAQKDSLENSIADAQAYYEGKIADLESEISALKDEQKAQERNARAKVSRMEDISEILLEWALLLIFAVALPCVLIYIYREINKEKQRRFDTIVDLVRSGIEIKPEILDYLTGTNEHKLISGAGFTAGMSRSDIDYCSKRILWGVMILLTGFIISVLAHNGVPFQISLIFGLFFILQAVLRYFNIRYYNKHIDKTEDNAQ